MLIKPSDKSKYNNFVDVLDEMKIVNIQSYAVVDITKEDIEILQQEQVY